jgi:hypothetical protein
MDGTTPHGVNAKRMKFVCRCSTGGASLKSVPAGMHPVIYPSGRSKRRAFTPYKPQTLVPFRGEGYCGEAHHTQPNIAIYALCDTNDQT